MKSKVFLFIEIVFLIIFVLFSIYFYFFMLIPEKNVNIYQETELDNLNIDIYNLQKEEEKITQNLNKYIQENKDTYEEYEKWNKKNQEIVSYL